MTEATKKTLKINSNHIPMLFCRKRKISSKNGTNKTKIMETCKICWETEAESTLIVPCRCSGTMKYVHPQCLTYWLLKKPNHYCEVCKTVIWFSSNLLKNNTSALHMARTQEDVVHSELKFVLWCIFWYVVIILSLPYVYFYLYISRW